MNVVNTTDIKHGDRARLGLMLNMHSTVTPAFSVLVPTVVEINSGRTELYSSAWYRCSKCGRKVKHTWTKLSLTNVIDGPPLAYTEASPNGIMCESLWQNDRKRLEELNFRQWGTCIYAQIYIVADASNDTQKSTRIGRHPPHERQRQEEPKSCHRLQFLRTAVANRGVIVLYSEKIHVWRCTGLLATLLKLLLDPRCFMENTLFGKVMYDVFRSYLHAVTKRMWRGRTKLNICFLSFT